MTPSKFASYLTHIRGGDGRIQPIPETSANANRMFNIAGVRTHPNDTIAHLDCRCGDIVRPKVKGTATSEIKTGVMPMAG
jgi:hypothetical protein